MKIRILSIHSAHNYGSVLQAYALMKSLQSYSNDVEIINYRPEYFEKEYRLFSIAFYKKYDSWLKKIIYFIVRIIFFRKRLIKYKKFESFMERNYFLSKDKYKSYNDFIENTPDGDVYICGSDQIWNTDITEGIDNVYFLKFVKQGKKVSYAASLGRKIIDEKYFEEYKTCLSSFDAISVREESSLEEFKKLGLNSVEVVLDPTLLLSMKEWELMSFYSKLKMKEPYLLVYRLENTVEFNNIVKSVSKLLGLKIVSLNKIKSYNREINFPQAGPEDFLYLFKNAEFIITNSFHGTVFSILFEKKQIIVPNTTKPYRMLDLMNKVGLQRRIINKISELNSDILYEEIDYKQVKINLEYHIEKSKKFIESTLR